MDDGVPGHGGCTMMQIFYGLTSGMAPKYHLGGDFFRDKDGTLCCGAQTYVKRLVET